MKKQNLLILSFLIMGVLLLFANSCKKNEDKSLPELSTTTVTGITQTTAISGGNITSDGGATVTASGVCWSTAQTPTISDNKTTDGKDFGNFTSNISGLTPNTLYYIRAYATNSVGTGYGKPIYFSTEHVNSAGNLTDTRDGNVYRTITIGNQIWMAENLRYLPSVVGADIGSAASTHYYVYGYNGTNVSDAKATSNYTNYGVLYNWSAACNSCPTGWHLPSYNEWGQLTTYLGGENVAGGKLKEMGTTHWYDPNTGATNETGFTARPGGSRHSSGVFTSIEKFGFWWSATEHGTTTAMSITMTYNNSRAGTHSGSRELGMSIRCVKD